MLNLKEIASIVIITIILAFTISLMRSVDAFLAALVAIAIILFVNVLVKKSAAYLLESEIEISIWEWSRYGFKPHWKFKKPVAMGAILPIILTVLTYGYITWLAPLVFDVKKKVYRAARRWGLYTFSEITEYHTGVIAAWGIVANLILAIAGYLLGFETFARLNIYFACFNLIPAADLDGNKIFFGSLVLWSFLAVISLIALGYALFVI